MDASERRLASLLHDVIPEPPNPIALDTIAMRVAGGPPHHRRGQARFSRARWSPALAAACVVLVAGVAFGIDRHNQGRGSAHARLAAQPTHSTPLASPSQSPSSGGTAPRCVATNLIASIPRSGLAMTQPFIAVALINKGPSLCSINGYPHLSASGITQSTSGKPTSALRPLRILLGKGGLIVPILPDDPVPHTVLLKPGTATWFTVRTETRSGTFTSIRVLEITVPGDASAIRLVVPPSAGLTAMEAPGTPIPIVVSPFNPAP
jgi:hypothetical protein